MLVPTRELALQTSAIVKELSKHMEVQVMVSTGGTNLRDDIMRLESVTHVIVGTPGRIHDLADKKIMFLRHHGMIACGKTIHEALFYCYHLELACKTQIAAFSSGAELLTIDKKICKQANHDLLSFEKDLGLRDWQAWVRWIDRGS